MGQCGREIEGVGSASGESILAGKYLYSPKGYRLTRQLTVGTWAGMS